MFIYLLNLIIFIYILFINFTVLFLENVQNLSVYKRCRKGKCITAFLFDFTRNSINGRKIDKLYKKQIKFKWENSRFRKNEKKD